MEIRVRGDLHHRLWECAGHTFSHATEPGASAEKANTTVCDHSVSATTLSVSHRGVLAAVGGGSRLRCEASSGT